MDYIISIVMVLVFAGLIAWDNQKIRYVYEEIRWSGRLQAGQFLWHLASTLTLSTSSLASCVSLEMTINTFRAQMSSFLFFTFIFTSKKGIIFFIIQKEGVHMKKKVFIHQRKRFHL